MKNVYNNGNEKTLTNGNDVEKEAKRHLKNE
jgi:hypothetical protein